MISIVEIMFLNYQRRTGRFWDLTQLILSYPPATLQTGQSDPKHYAVGTERLKYHVQDTGQNRLDAILPIGSVTMPDILHQALSYLAISLILLVHFSYSDF